MRCQFFIDGKKVGLFAMTEQQHLLGEKYERHDFSWCAEGEM
jgi:hypothetical protein